MEGPRTGRVEFGCKGGGDGWGGGSIGRADRLPGDLWTRHSVIALDPFVFKRSQRKRGGDGGGGGGGVSGTENGLQ